MVEKVFLGFLCSMAAAMLLMLVIACGALLVRAMQTGLVCH